VAASAFIALPAWVRALIDPNNFASLAELEARLLAFGDRYRAIATPFEWRFTRLDLHRVLAALVPQAQAALSPIFENPQTRSAKLPRLTSPGRAAQA